MARNNRKTDDNANEVISSEVSSEEITSTPTSSEDTNMSTEVTESEVTENDVNTNDDANLEDSTSEDTNAEETKPDTDADPYVPLESIDEVIPVIFEGYGDDPSVTSSANLAKSLIEMGITFRNSYLDTIAKLKSASFDTSEANVFALAKDEETQTKNVLVKTLLSQAEDAKREYETKFNELIAQVKDALNIVHLDDATKDTLEKDATKTLTSVAGALDNMERFESMNPMNTIQPAIDWFKELPALPPIKSGRKFGASTAAASTGEKTPRPRLGKSGYIKVGAKPFDNFASAFPAVKQGLKHLGKPNAITVTELHAAWYKAAGVEMNDWKSVPVQQEISFEFDTLPITIMRCED